jgi:hypothetical protein
MMAQSTPITRALLGSVMGKHPRNGVPGLLVTGTDLASVCEHVTGCT